jgi:hypothetical protein
VETIALVSKGAEAMGIVLAVGLVAERRRSRVRNRVDRDPRRPRRSPMRLEEARW